MRTLYALLGRPLGVSLPLAVNASLFNGDYDLVIQLHAAQPVPAPEHVCIVDGRSGVAVDVDGRPFVVPNAGLGTLA